MANRCEACGNDYGDTLQITLAGATHTFDSFECAIQALAPSCEHCGVRIIGHGVERAGRTFCSAYCAAKQGGAELRDRS